MSMRTSAAVLAGPILSVVIACSSAPQGPAHPGVASDDEAGAYDSTEAPPSTRHDAAPPAVSVAPGGKDCR